MTEQTLTNLPEASRDEGYDADLESINKEEQEAKAPELQNGEAEKEYDSEEVASFDDAAEAMAENEEDTDVNFEELARRDLAELASRFPETRNLRSITDLPNALRYAELRDLGLSPTEAYLATGKLRTPQDNRAHLHSSVPKGSSDAGSYMKASELNSARELFSSLSDDEIRRLYKRVVG